MAKTYFGYQPQAREAQINWSDIATEVSGSISGALKERYDKKEAIKQASRDYTKTLNDVEQGQHATANQWWLQAAHQAQEQMLMQDRLLQDGHIKLNEYTIMRQNLNDGTDNMIKVFSDFQTTYADKLARLQGSDDELGESQKLESWAFEQVQKFFNFNESGFLINPESGAVSIGKLDPDGKVIADPSALQSASTFNAFVNMSADKYDLEAASTTYVDELGTWDIISRRIGGDTAKGLITKMRTNGWDKELTTEEIKQLGLSVEEGEAFNIYLTGEDLFVSEVMSNPYHTSSILTNSLGVYKGDGQGSGEVFTFTRNKDEAGGNIIYVSQDNAGGRLSPEYTEEQEELVQEAIRTSVRSKLDVEVETKVVDDFKTPTSTQVIKTASDEAQLTALGYWNEIGTATSLADKQAAADAIVSTQRSIDAGLIGINIDGSTAQFFYTNPAKDRVIEIPANPTRSQWQRIGLEVHGVNDASQLNTASGLWNEGGYIDFMEGDQKYSIESGRRGTTVEADPFVETMNAVKNKFNADVFTDKESAVLAKIQPTLAALGFSSDQGGATRYDIWVQNPETEEFIWIKSADGQAAADKLNTWISGQLSNEAAARFMKLNVGESGVDYSKK